MHVGHPRILRKPLQETNKAACTHVKFKDLTQENINKMFRVPTAPKQLQEETTDAAPVATQTQKTIHWSMPEAGLVTVRDTYGVKFKEVPWWDGAKAGYYFGTWTHDDGRVLLGYVSDRGVIPCSAFLGKKTNRIYTTRDGILGYHHDVGPSAIKTDSLIDQEVRKLGWGVSICPEPCSSFGPQQPEPEPTCPEDIPSAKLQQAPSADDEEEGYTLRAATMMLNRLKKNKGRLSALGDKLKSMVLSDDPEVTKNLKSLIMKNNGNLKEVELQSQDIVESNDGELGLSRVSPMTRAQAACLSCAALDRKSACTKPDLTWL